MQQVLLQLDDQGVPWAVDPCPRPFVLPDGDGALHGVVLAPGTPCDIQGSQLIGTAGTRDVAAALEGTGDVVIVGAKVRYRIANNKLEDRKLHEICATHDSAMRRNGLRLLKLVDASLRAMSDRGGVLRLQAIVRWFPCVALRHPQVSATLDRVGVDDGAIRRWFGLTGTRGRPGRQIGSARTAIGTLVHECEEDENVNDAFERLARTGMGSRESLANRRSAEGELYQLSVGGIWVAADRLLERPWVPPRAAAMRWDIHIFQHGAPKQEGESK